MKMKVLFVAVAALGLFGFNNYSQWKTQQEMLNMMNGFLRATHMSATATYAQNGEYSETIEANGFDPKYFRENNFDISFKTDGKTFLATISKDNVSFSMDEKKNVKRVK